MKVTFYATKPDGSGQEIVTTITLQGEKVTYTGNPTYVNLLFDHGELDQGVEAVRTAMQQAPHRFDGGYLRASCEE